MSSSVFMKQLGINEVYLPVNDFPNYEVSNYGNVRNVTTSKILKNGTNSRGYQFVILYNDEKKQIARVVHRLVITAFEINYDNKQCVDHINNDKSDNCLFNLRYVSQQQNMFNRQNNKNNKSGHKGISWHKPLNKWVAYINCDGKRVHLGYFDDLESAKQSRINKAKILFGEYINSCELL